MADSIAELVTMGRPEREAGSGHSPAVLGRRVRCKPRAAWWAGGR